MYKILFIISLICNCAMAMERAQKPKAIVVGHGPSRPAGSPAIKRTRSAFHQPNAKRPNTNLLILCQAAAHQTKIEERARKEIQNWDAELQKNS